MLVAQFNDDLAAAPLAFHLFDFVGSLTFARPAVALSFGMPGAREDAHAFGDHENAVETNTELADQIGVFISAFGEGLEKSPGAGMGDGAEILHQFFPRHADAE